MVAQQGNLRFGAVANSGLFSNHWLEHRLRLEPDWAEQQARSLQALQQLSELWKVQKARVEKYGDEQGLEEAFIQPVLRALGWKFKYQTYLQKREPDYALFLDDAALDAAIQAGRKEPDFWKYPVALADSKAWHITLDRPTVVGKNREYPGRTHQSRVGGQRGTTHNWVALFQPPPSEPDLLLFAASGSPVR